MRLIQINHDRCDEYDGASLLYVPDATTVEMVEASIELAKADYLKAATAYREVEGVEQPSLDKMLMADENRGRTISDVRAEYDVLDEAWKERWNAQQAASKSFTSLLVGHIPGAMPFWDYEHRPEFDCDWGHRHGTHVDYGETKTDDDQRVDGDTGRRRLPCDDPDEAPCISGIFILHRRCEYLLDCEEREGGAR